ncbi:MAG: LmeA family phospholipid-binding protein [Cyanobacteriota bacterium]|nr:LmeA family phospholipid-binding protein [Cyanobacteriota bacterium]
MDTSTPSIDAAGGPVLGLLARGLELWVRAQCQAVGSVDIQLLGGSRQLLRGELSGVRLRARRVRYRDLPIERVELECDAIRVRMGQLLRGGGALLDQPFRIRGQVVFTGEGLSQALSLEPWRQIGDALAEEVIGVGPLAAVRLDSEQLVLEAPPAAGDSEPLQVATRLQASDGTLLVHRLDGSLASRLPMDPNIRIEQAQIGTGLLELQGSALVLP